jgi:alpha-beta hydrolase superfamily lysophospholipase
MIFGAEHEKFEQCILDLDAWIEFAIERGYSKIILSGHSLGTEKVVYYMNKGKHKNKVSALVLLAPADSPRWRQYDDTYHLSGVGKTRLDKAIDRAKMLITEGRGSELVVSAYGENSKMIKTPESLLTFVGNDTEILKTLPFHSGRLEEYKKIDKPIFAAIGNEEEYTAIPPDKALELMKRENHLTETHLLDCDHDFTGKEGEISDLVTSFILNHGLK